MTRVVQRVLSLLEAFDSRTPSLSLHEIAQRTGLPKTTAFRLLVTLVDEGYVIQQGDQSYCLSHKLMRLAAVAQRTFSIRDIAAPVMHQLVAETGETVELSTLTSHYERMCIEVVESPNPLKSIIHLGETTDLLHGASGAVFLAYSDPAYLEDVLRKGKATDKREAVQEKVRTVRQKGYAHSKGERVEGAEAISVPLLDFRGDVRYCLTLTGPAFRVSHRTDGLVAALIAAGHKISERLGGMGEIDPNGNAAGTGTWRRHLEPSTP